MPPGTLHIHSFIHAFIHPSIHPFIHPFVHPSMRYVALVNNYCWPFALLHLWQLLNRGCQSLHCAKQQMQSRAACLLRAVKLHTAKHPPCTHPAPTPPPPPPTPTPPPTPPPPPHPPTHTPQPPRNHPAPTPKQRVQSTSACLVCTGRSRLCC